MPDKSPVVSPVAKPITSAVALPITGGGAEEIGPDGYLLLEIGDKLILEDASGNLLLEG